MVEDYATLQLSLRAHPLAFLREELARQRVRTCAELERIRPRTRLIEKPYSLVLLVETLEEMLSSSQNLLP